MSVATVSCASRTDLDLDTDSYEKLPDLFSVSLDIKVSNEERPARNEAAGIADWSPSNANKLTPFSGREEYDQTLLLYGKYAHVTYSSAQLYKMRHFVLYVDKCEPNLCLELLKVRFQSQSWATITHSLSCTWVVGSINLCFCALFAAVLWHHW